MSNAFFNLERPRAPRLIQYLYGLALVLIAVMTVAGVVGGVRTMARAEPPPVSAAAPDAAATPQPGAMRPGIGPRRFARDMRERRFGPRGPMMLPGMPPAVRGGAIVVLVLLRALIAWMVVRILAEMGNTILKLRSAVS